MVVLRDMRDDLGLVKKHPTPLQKLEHLHTIEFDLEQASYAVDYQMLSRIFGSLATLTTLNLDSTCVNQTEIDVELVLEFV